MVQQLKKAADEGNGECEHCGDALGKAFADKGDRRGSVGNAVTEFELRLQAFLQSKNQNETAFKSILDKELSSFACL